MTILTFRKKKSFWKVIARKIKSGRKTTFYLQEGHFEMDNNELHPGFICFGAGWRKKNDFAFYGSDVSLAVDAIEANYGVEIIEWKRY